MRSAARGLMDADGVEAQRAAYDELAAYTMPHASPAFIHQYVVDAWGAQSADAAAKPIRLAFSLAGLYLHLERGFTGRQVQRVHMLLAQRTRDFPRFAIPAQRGDVTVHDVMAAVPGDARDAAIERWCASVWAAYRDVRADVLAMLAMHGIG